MIYLIGVSATDEAVLDERGTTFRILPRNLARMAWNSSKKGSPMLLGHDFNNLMGWTKSFGIHLEPKLVRQLITANVIENNQEYKQIVNQYNEYYNDNIVEKKDEFRELKTLIYENLNKQEVPYFQSYVCFFEKDLATRVFPHLASKFDKDGLILIGELEPLDLGIYRIGELCVFAHRLFRRSFNILNILNFPFLYQLKLLENSNLNIKIRLDTDMVGLASSLVMHYERDYWWGPFFDDNISSIKPGETQYGIGTHKSYTSLIRTDFNWHLDKGKYVFEAEEVYSDPSAINPPVNNVDYYGCRYVHSIISEDLTEVHFDGAVRAYTKELLLRRINKNITKSGRKSNYFKLWRLDGEIPVPIWKRLLSDYFRDNFLVGEYLGGKDKMLDTYVSEQKPEKIVKEDFIPPIQLLISFHQWNHNITNERLIVSMHQLTQCINDKFLNFLETHKISFDLSSKLMITKEIKEIFRIPLIIHTKNRVSECVMKTIEIFRDFLDIMKDFEEIQIFGVNFGYPIKNDEIRISILGDKNEIMKFFNHKISHPKFEKEDFLEWVDLLSDYLKKTYPKIDEYSEINSRLNIQGIL